MEIAYYCEIINCNKIILSKHYFWFIKDSIKLNNSNIIIEIDKKNNYLKYNKFYSKIVKLNTFFAIKPENRIYLIRNEIFKNLPKIKCSKSDLYIHIRSEDIFKKMRHYIYVYAQPPLCFYKSIINDFKFEKIIIISKDKFNPIINKLINKYNNIIYHKNDIKKDISILLYAFNIVSSISSFLIMIIQINYNLKFLFDYNLFHMDQKLLLFHYDVYKYPNRLFTIYRMEPSNIYKKFMFFWKNNKKQRKLMIKEKCDNYFRIIEYKT